MRNWIRILAAGLGVLLAGQSAVAEEPLPPGTELVKVEAVPSSISLSHAFDYRQILLFGELSDGSRIDVTRMATVQAPEFVELSAGALVRPKADGTGQIQLTVGSQTVAIPVAVSGQTSPYMVNFWRDVMPVLSKMGCNAGTCHGAVDGKNGFKLSLRGYDARFDYLSFTDDLASRRINRASPDESLMLLKPSGEVPHVGGVLTRDGQPYYRLIREWIAQGLVFDAETPKVTKIEVYPQGPVIPLPGMKQQMSVLATYSDGLVRDVTAEAFVESSNTETAEVDKSGLVTAVRRGESAMLARFEGNYAASTLIVMGDRSGFQWTDVAANNEIDELVYAKLKRMRILPSDLCTDADFIRRLYLDLIGIPPEPEEVRAFLADPRPTKEKRDELVDRLVGSPDYIENWTNKWSDLLQVNRKFLGEEGAWATRNWVRQAIATNMPYDRFVHTVLTASGSSMENPPAAYYKVLREPGLTVENTTQLFLGIRFSCNKCHDHPFERWTQDQYYQLAAYFARVGLKDDPAFKNQRVGGSAVDSAVSISEIVYDLPSGEVKHARTGQETAPKFPFTHADLAPESATRREQVAHWITSPDNPYFAKNAVNRMWGYLMGVGLIEPIDDTRAGNPPSNPELLERLTADFKAGGFDVQAMMRQICKSRVYQHSIAANQWNEDDSINYSHALARRLPAETLFDAVKRATGSTTALPGLPVGFRAVQTPDSQVSPVDSFFDLFGRPPRESACECERSGGVMLGQALNLVNGPTIAEAIADPNNRIARLEAQIKDDGQLVDELFLSILCRFPTEGERATGRMALAEGESRLGGAQDLAWVLINSPAFLFNH
jgi:hypothetical protein